MKAQLDEAAARILHENDRGGYTVPTRRLYPFRWNWDSCFVTLGWARLDEDRAFTEIETLLQGQWPGGMVPHIIFHRPDAGYFPGPERWGTGHTPPTSGITQPPVVASCMRRLLEGARDAEMAERRARALLPKLLAWHRWFHTVRDPVGTGVVTTLHPWETGMDNSPAWDEALARIEVPQDREA
jgi:alpha,alpha-trehalase